MKRKFSRAAATNATPERIIFALVAFRHQTTSPRVVKQQEQYSSRSRRDIAIMAVDSRAHPPRRSSPRGQASRKTTGKPDGYLLGGLARSRWSEREPEIKKEGARDRERIHTLDHFPVSEASREPPQ